MKSRCKVAEGMLDYCKIGECGFENYESCQYLEKDGESCWSSKIDYYEMLADQEKER